MIEGGRTKNINKYQLGRNYKSYSDYQATNYEWLGNIPKHWDMNIVNNLVTIKSGFPFNSNNFDQDTGFPLIRIRNIRGKSIDTYYNGKITKEMKDVIVQRNDVIVGMDGDFNVYWWDEERALLNQRMARITSNSYAIKRYLYYLLPYALEYIQDITPSTTVKHLSSSEIKKLKIPEIPINEQKVIVNFLDRETSKIDRLIEKQEKLIDLLEEKRKALISNTVTKGLDETVEMKDSGVDWFKTIPSHWETRKLKQVARIIPSNVDKKTKEGEKQVRLCNYSEVYNNAEITHALDFMVASARDQQINKLGLQKNDVVVTKDSESWDDIAVPAYIGEDIKDLVCGYHLAIIRPSPKDLLGKYLYFLLAAKGISDQFHVKANGVTRFGLSINDLQTSLIPIPPRKEQTAVVNYLNAQTEKINRANGNIRRSMGKLNEYRTALISAAVTGKIDVRGEVE